MGKITPDLFFILSHLSHLGKFILSKTEVLSVNILMVVWDEKVRDPYAQLSGIKNPRHNIQL